MDKRKGMKTSGAALWGKFISLLGILLLVFACSPSNQVVQDSVKEIQELKREVKALREKLDNLEKNQQALQTQMKQPAAPPEAAALPQPQPQLQPLASPPSLTVAQLLAGKEQYLGRRVTIKGEVGPVILHNKSFFLKSPQGMVEVLFGKLPDQMQVQRLTSITSDQQLTVTGVVSMPPKAATGATELQINAEAIDY